VLYVTRVVTYHKVYGSMATVPLFLAGVYFSWSIILLGAQVAYAYQNRRTYVQQKLAESVNQRGREFIALRLIAYIAERFQNAKAPATATQMAEELSVPLRLVSQIITVLDQASLVVQIAGEECGYAPARPINTMTAEDVLNAMRSGQGHELETAADPARQIIRTEFDAILRAERRVASSVTVQNLVERMKTADQSAPTN
jgi:membrane protein